MARNEQDREDLMKEATALVRRMEFSVNQQEETIFAGYKRNGSLSIYLHPDLVYHFDDQCRLRRAFIAPYLYRTEGDSLTRLERVRTETTSQLAAVKLRPENLSLFQKEMIDHLEKLKIAFTANQVNIHQQIPEDVNLIQELTESIEAVIRQQGKLSPAIVVR